MCSVCFLFSEPLGYDRFDIFSNTKYNRKHQLQVQRRVNSFSVPRRNYMKWRRYLVAFRFAVSTRASITNVNKSACRLMRNIQFKIKSCFLFQTIYKDGNRFASKLLRFVCIHHNAVDAQNETALICNQMI